MLVFSWFIVLSSGCSPVIAGPCKADALEKVARALGIVSRDHRVSLAAQGIAESCSFAAPLQEVLSRIVMSPPDYREMIALQGIAESGMAFETACPGGTSMLAGAIALKPAVRASLIFETCQPDFVAAGEAVGGDLLPLAILIRPEMAGNDATVRRTVLRGLSGL